MEMVHFIPPSQRRLAMLAAQADSAPVLISGASGTGKGAIARWIHSHGPRAGKAFILADRTLPLAESLAKAQGGSLLLDEIGEWSLSEQKTLLHFLLTRSVPGASPSSVTLLLNVRVMATSSQSLEGRAQGGLFNPDLLQKLNVFRLEMPPLSRRANEFDDIVQGLVGEITRDLHREHIRGISPEAWSRLRAYEWPGNLRELRNVLRVAVIACKGDSISAEDLPEFGHERVDFRATREEFEKTYILELLRTFDWQIDTTCRMSRIDKPTLLEKMRRYGIPLHP